ncbi:MAG: SDR family oxidoreductase [Rubricoccaceae bacterium]
MTLDLDGRVALVTGASRGIGWAIAEALAAAGATVALHHSGRDPSAADALAATCGNNSRAFAADLRQLDAPQTLWDEIEAEYGRIDVLVNNAGVFRTAPLSAPLEDWLHAWDETLSINLRAAAVLCRAAARHAHQREAEGVRVRVINVSSRAAFRGDDPEFLAYAASKGGLVALTKSMARGLGRHGLAAFGVAPGFTETDMAAEAIAENGEALRGQLALDRLTQPQDIAPIVVLLASGLADHATGTTIDVNAGSYVR